jgi:hypothetical protein
MSAGLTASPARVDPASSETDGCPLASFDTLGELPVITNYRWIGAITIALALAGGSAEAQPFYGGGYWGGGYGGYGGAGSTVQGSMLQGAGMAAMGLGRYNVDTAQARSINAQTAMQWNQYMYESEKEGNRVYYELNQQKLAREKGDYKAVKDRLRTNPNSVDIADGNALNIALEDLKNPNMFQKAVYAGGKMKLGGQAIRNIPFQYASAGISTSVHQLTQGGAPPVLKNNPAFDTDREKLRAIAADIRKEAEQLGSPKPETIKKAKDQIMATKAKVEATFPQSSQDRRDAEKYIKSLYCLASMLETPAINVLLAGVENRPEATIGDLLGFMSAYNLRFGASETNDQGQVYMMLYPMIAKLRDDVSGAAGSAPPMSPTAVQAAPGEVFGALDYNHAEKKVPPPPAPR